MRSTLSNSLLAAALITASLFTLNPTQANAAVPRTINYQGQLKNASGNPVSDGTYTMRFRIYSGTTISDFVLWSSGNQSVTTQGGLFSYVLGSNTPFPANLFSNPSFVDSIRYLGIKVGTDPEMTPRIRLEPTAFAQVAETVPDNAITSNKIAPFTIANNDIADNAVETYVVKDNSLKARDLLDEPGVASSIKVPAVDISSSGTVVDSIVITTPASGYVMVTANGTFNLDFNGSSLFSGSSILFATIADQGATMPSLSSVPYASFTLDNGVAFGFYRSPFAVTMVFQVVGAGAHTFYLWSSTGTFSPNSQIVSASMTALYVPTAYGAIAPLPTSPNSQGNIDTPVETRRVDDAGNSQSGQSQRDRQ